LFAIARKRTAFAIGKIVTYITDVLDFGEKQRTCEPLAVRGSPAVLFLSVTSLQLG
jgi:hypothetical protein